MIKEESRGADKNLKEMKERVMQTSGRNVLGRGIVSADNLSRGEQSGVWLQQNGAWGGQTAPDRYRDHAESCRSL